MSTKENIAMASQSVRIVAPTATESDVKKEFIATHQDELVSELAAAWKTSGDALKLLEFLKTHGGLTPVESEIIVGAGKQSRHRAEALMTTMLSKEDVCGVWESFWLGVSRQSPPVFKKFCKNIEEEIGYFALIGITPAPPVRETHRTPTESGRGNLLVPEPALDSASGSTGDHDSSGHIASSSSASSHAVSRTITFQQLEEKVQQYHAERNAARKERTEAVSENFRLTHDIHTAKKANTNLQKQVDSLESLKAQLTAENEQLCARTKELTASVEVIRSNHRTQVATTQSTLQQLIDMQEADRSRRRQVLTLANTVNDHELKIIESTTALDKAMRHLANEQKQSFELRSQLESTRCELDEAVQRLSESVPGKCVRFACWRHSITDSGVQSVLSAPGEPKMVFIRDVDLNFALPLQTQTDVSSCIATETVSGGNAAETVTTGIATETVTLIKEITDENSQLLVGDEVREANGTVRPSEEEFLRLVTSGDHSSLLLKVRRRLALPVSGCWCEMPGGTAIFGRPVLETTLSSRMVAANEASAAHCGSHQRTSSTGFSVSPPPTTSPSESVMDDAKVARASTAEMVASGGRPESSADRCGVSTTSSTVHHKADIGGALSAEELLPAELSVSESVSLAEDIHSMAADNDVSTAATAAAASAIRIPVPQVAEPKAAAATRSRPLRTVRLAVEALRATSDGDCGGSPRSAASAAADRNRSLSIPHLGVQSTSSLRRASEPQVGSSGIDFDGRLFHSGSKVAGGCLGDSAELASRERNPSDMYRKVDQPLRLNDQQLRSLGVGPSERRREIALTKVKGVDLSFTGDEGWVLIGGRGCGTYIQDAPQWVLDQLVEPGDRILFIQSKDVRNAPREMTNYWLDNAVAFSQILHIVVERDEEGYRKVLEMEAREDFYVRANFNYVPGPNFGSRANDLPIGYGDILHIRDTMPGGIGRWAGCKVKHYKDTECRGKIPCPTGARQYVLQVEREPLTSGMSMMAAAAAMLTSSAEATRAPAAATTTATATATATATTTATAASPVASGSGSRSRSGSGSRSGSQSFSTSIEELSCSPRRRTPQRRTSAAAAAAAGGGGGDHDEDPRVHGYDNPFTALLAAAGGEGGRGRVLTRAIRLFRRGVRSQDRLTQRRSSQTVTQVMSENPELQIRPPASTPPFEYIELVKGEKYRPVVLFGSFTHIILRELQKHYPSSYSLCNPVHFDRPERLRRMERGEIVSTQALETADSGFRCITIDEVYTGMNHELSPLLEGDLSCIRRLQSHGLYAVSICMKPTTPEKLRAFLVTLCGRPFTDAEVTAEFWGVQKSYRITKNIWTDVFEIKGRFDKDIHRLHRLISKNMRAASWVSSLDQPEYLQLSDK